MEFATDYPTTNIKVSKQYKSTNRWNIESKWTVQGVDIISSNLRKLHAMTKDHS